MKLLSEPTRGMLNLRQLSDASAQGGRKDMHADLQRIHFAARQVFEGVLAQPALGSFTLGRMLGSLKRQIEAAQDLQQQLVNCGGDEALRSELANLLLYLEVTSEEVAARLGIKQPNAAKLRGPGENVRPAEISCSRSKKEDPAELLGPVMGTAPHFAEVGAALVTKETGPEPGSWPLESDVAAHPAENDDRAIARMLGIMFLIGVACWAALIYWLWKFLSAAPVEAIP